MAYVVKFADNEQGEISDHWKEVNFLQESIENGLIIGNTELRIKQLSAMVFK